MQALDLTEESLRILWPPESSSLSRTSSFMVNRHPNQRDVAAVTEFGITSTPRKFGPFKSRYACCKIILGGGGKSKAPLLNGSKPEKTQLGLATGRRTSGEADIAPKL